MLHDIRIHADLKNSTAAADADLLRLGAEFREAWAKELALAGDEPDFEAVMERCASLSEMIQAIPAHSIEGQAVKAAALFWRQDNSPDWFPVAEKLLAA